MPHLVLPSIVTSQRQKNGFVFVAKDGGVQAVAVGEHLREACPSSSDEVIAVDLKFEKKNVVYSKKTNLTADKVFLHKSPLPSLKS